MEKTTSQRIEELRQFCLQKKGVNNSTYPTVIVPNDIFLTLLSYYDSYPLILELIDDSGFYRLTDRIKDVVRNPPRALPTR